MRADHGIISHIGRVCAGRFKGRVTVMDMDSRVSASAVLRSKLNAEGVSVQYLVYRCRAVPSSPVAPGRRWRR
jgi:hypothetical protein